MRIGILGHGFIGWGGGIDFLRIVASGLHHSGAAVELHVLVPTRGVRATAKRALRYAYCSTRSLVGRPVVMPTRPDARHLRELASSAEQALTVHEIDIGSLAIETAARKLSLDALIPAMAPLPPHFPRPWVGYIYDFQHRYFPQLFSPTERRQRDRHFSALLARAPAVIVNARSVAADIAQFYPEARARVFSLPFSAAPQPEWLKPGDSPAPRYGINKPYFIICNQFWKHKDHATAFAAFARFATTRPEVDLVCTGATDDYRDPKHFSTLQQALMRDGIFHRVHILGMVPKADQIALLKGSIALVQPTLFEGGPGGGAVYDAVSLGLRCLVSDIAVNRELVAEGVALFRAGDVSGLAELMAATIRLPCLIDRAPEVLLALGRARRAACGAELLAAIKHAHARF